MNGASNLANVVDNEASKLASVVNNGFIIKKCLEYNVDVKVPLPIHKLSQEEQEKGIKQDHYFPGGYISPLGEVFSSYQAFHNYTQ